MFRGRGRGTSVVVVTTTPAPTHSATVVVAAPPSSAAPPSTTVRHYVEYAFHDQYEKVWDDRHTGADPFDGSLFHPIAPAGFFAVGSVAVRGQVDHPHVRALVVREPAPTAGVPHLLAAPTSYTKVWEDKGTGGRYGDCSLWWPNAPAGYVAIGIVAVKGYNQPHQDLVRCIHLSAVVPAHAHPEADGQFIWCDRKSRAKFGDVSLWSLHAPGAVPSGGFVSANSYTLPNANFFAVSESPKGPVVLQCAAPPSTTTVVVTGGAPAHHHHHSGPTAVVVTPTPTYTPPPVAYAPPPVAYAPPPVYAAPPSSAAPPSTTAAYYPPPATGGHPPPPSAVPYAQAPPQTTVFVAQAPPPTRTVIVEPAHHHHSPTVVVAQPAHHHHQPTVVVAQPAHHHHSPTVVVAQPAHHHHSPTVVVAQPAHHDKTTVVVTRGGGLFGRR